MRVRALLWFVEVDGGRRSSGDFDPKVRREGVGAGRVLIGEDW